MHLSNVHDANFATALELGRRLGHKIPSENEIYILAIEVEDNFTFAETMTARLEALFPIIADEIFEEMLGLLRNGPGMASWEKGRAGVALKQGVV